MTIAPQTTQMPPAIKPSKLRPALFLGLGLLLVMGWHREQARVLRDRVESACYAVLADLPADPSIPAAGRRAFEYVGQQGLCRGIAARLARHGEPQGFTVRGDPGDDLF